MDLRPRSPPPRQTRLTLRFSPRVAPEPQASACAHLRGMKHARAAVLRAGFGPAARGSLTFAVEEFAIRHSSVPHPRWIGIFDLRRGRRTGHPSTQPGVLLASGSRARTRNRYTTTSDAVQRGVGEVRRSQGTHDTAERSFPCARACPGKRRQECKHRTLLDQATLRNSNNHLDCHPSGGYYGSVCLRTIAVRSGRRATKGDDSGKITC